MKKEKPVAQIALTISSRPGRAAEENPIFRGMQIAMDELTAAPQWGAQGGPTGPP